MKNPFSSRRLVIAVIIAILTIAIITISSNARNSKAEPSLPSRVLSDITGWTAQVVGTPVKALTTSVASVQQLLNTYQENEKLTTRIDELAQAKVQLQTLQAENKALKNQLNLDSTLTDFKVVNAVVISRSPSNWQSQIIINKGTDAGLKRNMSVMGSGGLVGRIVQVNTTNSKVELISDNSQTANRFAIRVATSNGEVVDGIISGFNQTKNEIIMSNITSQTEVKKGDMVTTSGLGGVTPSGLYVGKVDAVTKDEGGVSKQILIKPATDFNNIPVVSVAIPQS
ncbi:rod shape-determining protein MreC [Weissella oryzae SG25]|uniref:Cell shape-determining protein MreC n=1 Tax=Weissella oryzae (strain DSM 25784 / JCM 18191 / LMG 30913 / SG25) TaxID=1329250 RepID=A0A069CS33_WEIOS|nr:rod shape-determining protein MreC [Weissella oryzae]GAK30615.1 rod shape-determining protein MreC [Weissella oryzae SG25]